MIGLHAIYIIFYTHLLTDCVSGDATILSVTPGKGPMAGGSELLIQTRELEGNVTVISVAGVLCQNPRKGVSSGSYLCTTGRSSQIRNGTIRISYTENDGDNDDVTSTRDVMFHYMKDPTITPISRKDVIVSGGVILTVNGENLMSVEKPQSQITRVWKGSTKVVPSATACKVRSSKEILCLAPDLRPVTASRRRKRSVSSLVDGRFYFGVLMDGVRMYRNITEVLVYTGPEYHKFQEDGHVKYIGQDEKELTIKGVNLNRGCRKTDVMVSVGDLECALKELNAETLVCTLPAKSQNTTSSQRVKVGVGISDFETKTPILTFDVGSIRYRTKAEGLSLVSILIISVVILIVVFALTVGTIIYCAKERRKRGAREKSKQNKRVKEGFDNRQFVDRTRIPDGDQSDVRYVPNVHQEMTSPPVPQQEVVRMPERNIAAPIASRDMVDNAHTITNSPSGVDGNLSSSGYLQPRTEYPSNSLARHPGFPPPEYNMWDYIDEDLKFRIRDCLIDPERISLGRVIGQGQFGKVFLGVLSLQNSDDRINVAVKTVSGDSSPNNLVDFLEEALIMKDFNHPHILQLLGVVVEYNKPYVVLPYMEYGDLRSYVKDPSQSMTLRQLVSMGLQVAQGMEYLEDNRFVHRDLAARNCMVSRDLVVKIADFGLARDIYSTDYYRMSDKHKSVPVKWMAVESLENGVFSIKSDVWSFGVVMWELLTRGRSPYPDVSNYDIKEYVSLGRRLSKPPNTPMEVYQLMSSCWLEDSDVRPSFKDIVSRLSNILKMPHSSRPDSVYMGLVDT